MCVPFSLPYRPMVKCEVFCSVQREENSEFPIAHRHLFTGRKFGEYSPFTVLNRVQRMFARVSYRRKRLLWEMPVRVLPQCVFFPLCIFLSFVDRHCERSWNAITNPRKWWIIIMTFARLAWLNHPSATEWPHSQCDYSMYYDFGCFFFLCVCFLFLFFVCFRSFWSICSTSNELCRTQKLFKSIN